MAKGPAHTDSELVKAVHDAYSAKAVAGADPNQSSHLAKSFGYTDEQLQSIPAESHMGLSCGNPVAAASVKEGERVLDLGSGGGIDVLLAAAKTGQSGRAIGLDMSAAMIDLARKNALKRGFTPPQVAFIHCSLTEPLPINSDSMDCILSNCVINLLPLSGKASLLREVFRVLKPGGRVVLDDVIAKKELPDHILKDLTYHANCIAGAIQIDLYRQLFTDAGFKDVKFRDTKSDLSVWIDGTKAGGTPSCCNSEPAQIDLPAPISTDVSSELKHPISSCCSNGDALALTVDKAGMRVPSQAVAHNDVTYDINDWIASYQIYAIKDPLPQEPLQRWWDAYPPALSQPAKMSPERLAALMGEEEKGTSGGGGGDRGRLGIIDVRGADRAGGHVAGSVQCRAQTFFDALDTFHRAFGGARALVFYCSSSRGRAPRCAGWYLDYLARVAPLERERREEKGSVDGSVDGIVDGSAGGSADGIANGTTNGTTNETTNGTTNGSAGASPPRPEVFILEGGIKEWLRRYADVEALVAYD